MKRLIGGLWVWISERGKLRLDIFPSCTPGSLSSTRTHTHTHTQTQRFFWLALSHPKKKMEIFLLLILVCFTEAGPQKNLEDQVFLFPRRSATSYVLLKPRENLELEAFTICLSFYTELYRDFTFFSASSQDHSNEIVIFKEATRYELTLGDQSAFFKAPEEKSSLPWDDLCVTWESSTGVVQFWLNRIPLPRRVAAKGNRIKRDLIIMLGQDQDSYGGSLNAEQAFEGELGKVYMWDTVLPAEQIKAFQSTGVPVPLLDWSDLSYEIKGDVVMVPSLL